MLCSNSISSFILFNYQFSTEFPFTNTLFMSLQINMLVAIHNLKIIRKSYKKTLKKIWIKKNIYKNDWLSMEIVSKPKFCPGLFFSHLETGNTRKFNSNWIWVSRFDLNQSHEGFAVPLMIFPFIFLTEVDSLQNINKQENKFINLRLNLNHDFESSYKSE